MTTHSIGPATDMLDAAASYLPWGRDLTDWVGRMHSMSHFDRDQLRRLRAARAVLSAALGDVNAMIERQANEATNGNEAVREQA
ncbi:hypothetical protein [Bradyrhizobium ottawaense]|uniref:hypothetical protein n=1 Tax=Bradyrhizobium ottawaense TaxID=931866 RepID=UPI001BAB73C3|nr:hypothetical protein [Bradyrhizobium ottawaense]MBR1362936.1 hypothetical protein [Bradyrhizobium ottawaense]